MRDESKQNLRVGLLTVVALTLIAFTILMVGKRQQLFSHHTHYHTNFENVTGLDKGSPVKLDGVTVGFIDEIILPTHPSATEIRINFAIDSKYTERIRQDSRVSIRSMGLLGDRYLNISGGSIAEERILEGAEVPSIEPAQLSRFVASGEDLMQNLIAISSSLRKVLERVEAGEGLIGELTTKPESGARMSDSLTDAIGRLGDILARVDRGEGLLGRLVREDTDSGAIFDELVASSRAMHRISTQLANDVEKPDSIYAAVMRSRENGEHFQKTLKSLQTAAAAIASAAEELSTGQGTLPRLMKDKEFADGFLEDLQSLVHSLKSAAEKMDRGDGTAGAFINDPQLYKDLEDVVRGVKNNKVVSWFIRKERKKGEKLRQREENRKGETQE